MRVDTDGALAGKVAIVTGAGRGIGRAHALALAAAGATVVVNDRGVSLDGAPEAATPADDVVEEIVSAGGSAVASLIDISDDAEVERMVGETIENYGRLDILVNNAGILRDRMLVNMSVEEWDAVMRVHLNGHFVPLRHAASHWRQRSKAAGEPVPARLINTTSSSGLFGNLGQANYAAAKAGIMALTEVAAMELGQYGVTANAVAPCARTRMTDAIEIEEAAEGEFDPMDPANNSAVVVALCTDACQEITGRCFMVYGGLVSPLRRWELGPMLGDKFEPWEPLALAEAIRAEVPAGKPTPDALELDQQLTQWGEVGAGAE